eukprot:3908182-Rhodomonas_salina.5
MDLHKRRAEVEEVSWLFSRALSNRCGADEAFRGSKICNGAVNEQELELQLETVLPSSRSLPPPQCRRCTLSVREDWAETRFEFQNFKNKGPVLLKPKELAEIMEKLEVLASSRPLRGVRN